jgi:hypothetical protein
VLARALQVTDEVDDHRLSNRFGEAKIGMTYEAVNGCAETSRNRPMTRTKRVGVVVHGEGPVAVSLGRLGA